MREPYFWSVTDKHSRAASPMSKLLTSPLAMIYRWAGARRIQRTIPADTGIPVVCVGNLTRSAAAGKTPDRRGGAELLPHQGIRPASLSRGYRGSLQGAHRVDPSRHSASDVGDQPLMLSSLGESSGREGST